ncbi:hypothetical protein Asulf_00045 [Archaeoglobus sulfaticallidus PM70-1]|uniref:N-sulphoglucosamine sulphohydrolase C-terminal domain-containing protein n=1 Tax=Archaeoglobus sulfaticallidus PM70-1 TaxID=387631 RepID=N0BI18_9EURY|nr:hypothetical protein Asulf_00045 [Archaeoglobus sulfaticallidus PM70-1]
MHGGFEELYNLKEDPEEENNIIENDYEIAMELRDTLSKWVEHIENKKFEKAKIKEKIKRLRSFDKI